MAKKCTSSLEATRKSISRLNDFQIERGLAHHADPAWWKRPSIRRENQAYLRRWGTVLRREARRRGLL
jgi:hypothetical protein